MREFTFTLRYEAGADPTMDVFADYPELVAHSLDGCVTRNSFWRVEQFFGPPAALDAVERLRLDESVPEPSITETPVEADQYHDVLKRERDALVVYSFLDVVGGGESVHTLSGRYLPPGSLLETRRREDRHEWRILMRSDEKVGILYDALTANLRPGLSFEMGHLRDAEGWDRTTPSGVSLPPSQRSALEAAVDDGYYRTPREITLDELAAKLDVPRSTLSYRLQRAEAKVVSAFLGESE
ncbi:MAG: helix-turn-helix domain-containing protein [Haloplanus sp.]